MQLALEPDPRSETLRRLQALLVQRFGRIERAAVEWRRPEWVLVQGVIGARTKSEISNAATDRLLKRYGSWEPVADAPLEELQNELYTQTYPNIAAERLKGSLARLIELRDAVDLSHLAEMETLEAMRWLERLPGVGRKIAAGVMNASTLNRRAIVLDGHHRRILQRMGLVPPQASTDRAFDAIMPAIPGEWNGGDFDEHHLLIKKLGQTFCRPAAPNCSNCLALSLCSTGLERVGDS
ncbi:endonuclease III [Erythrobacter vulgaris]|uniref:Endonuclease III n=1 Tax=Qipengyuania vulgaris TaxID=291985 RepID=A0A844XTI2_9SPHN|nr:endonuclease III [Qipengyuania vulgaris]